MRIPVLRLELGLRVPLGMCITADRPYLGDEKKYPRFAAFDSGLTSQILVLATSLNVQETFN